MDAETGRAQGHMPHSCLKFVCRVPLFSLHSALVCIEGAPECMCLLPPPHFWMVPTSLATGLLTTAEAYEKRTWSFMACLFLSHGHCFFGAGPPVRKTTFELRSHANCLLPFLSLQDLVYVLVPRTYYEGSIKTRGLSSSSYSFLKNLVISRSLVRNTILAHKIQIQ